MDLFSLDGNGARTTGSSKVIGFVLAKDRCEYDPQLRRPVR